MLRKDITRPHLEFMFTEQRLGSWDVDFAFGDWGLSCFRLWGLTLSFLC